MPLKPESQSAFDNWIASFQGKLSPEEINQLRTTFSKDESITRQVADSVMMRSDYSRLTQQQQNDYNQRMTQLAERAAQLDKYDREIAQWEEYVKNNTVSAAEYAAATAELNQLKQYKAHTEARIRDLGFDELINDESEGYMYNQNWQNGYQNGQQPQNQSQQHQTNNPPNQNFDPSQLPGERYLTRQIAESKIQEAAVTSVVAQAALMDMDDEYRSLTGKGLPNRQTLIAEAIQAGKPLTDFIEEKFNLSQLRADAAKASQEAEITRRVEEQVARKMSEQRLPVPTGQAGSPVLQQTMAAMNSASPEEARANIPLFGKPGQQGRAAQRATESFLTGKYKGQTFNPWTA
jgi:hypothetical protein